MTTAISAPGAPSGAPSGAARLGWGVVAAAALAALAAALLAWPLPALSLGLALAAWAGLLWLRPDAWLVGLPALVVGLDLSPWTGWTMLAEGELFILATIAVLALRAPPPTGALRLGRGTAALVVLLVVATAVAVLRGLALPGADSANPYMRPDNALRLARPVAEALGLLPFLLAGAREAPRRLGWGLSLAVAAVAAEVAIERAMFPGLWSLSSEYRVAALFASMRVGGGHIGTFLAMALPAVPVLFLAVPVMARIGLAVVGAAGGYALAVTFARTAYGAAAAGLSVAVLAWGLLAPRGTTVRGRALAALGLAGLLVAALGTVASLGFMRERIGLLGADAAVRQANWAHGWAAHDASPAGWLLGSGLGTYGRVMLAADGTDPRREVPTDYVLAADAEGPFLTLKPSTPGFLGQKIAPPGGALRLALRWRAETPGATLGVILCEKHLLYSESCRGATLRDTSPGQWQAASLALAGDDLGTGIPPRPVELSIAGGPPGARLSVRDISLTDAAGRSLLANGDFRAGMARWGFTDDRHSAWRIFNLYLMTLFETGLLGLAALAALLAGGAVAAARLAKRGEPMGAGLLGGLAGFAIAGLFDHVMEAPSLALLVLLMALAARVGADS